MNEWRVHVEGLGKIKEADIDTKPFTLFVGDNNSGKSYLMTLIWGIYSCNQVVFRNYESMIKEGKIDIEVFRSYFSKINQEFEEKKEEISYKLPSEIIENLQESINVLIDENKDYLVRTLFNKGDMSIKFLTVTVLKHEKMELILKYDEELKYQVSGGRFGFGNYSPQEDRLLYMLYKELLCWYLYGEDLEFYYGIDRNEMKYLPVSRTGFMLTKEYVDRFSRKVTFGYREQEQLQQIQPLTKPITSFLDDLDSAVSSKNNTDNRVAKFIEQELCSGSIQVVDDMGKNVMYHPAGEEMSLPLTVTSGVVTELVPLILLLQSDSLMQGVFYEEPETCLHAKLQKKLTRALIRLVNSGIMVNITTHSDTILQHINNMLRLNTLKQKEELMEQYGYIEDDLLSIENVAVYQLDEISPVESKVTRLEHNEYGFVVPTFNDALDKILEEVYAFQQDEE